jgi:HSP20 family protein
MAIIKWTPLYEPFLDIERAFNDLTPSLSSYNPALDMYEKEGVIVIELAAVGIDPDNVHITVEDNTLHIEGSSEKKTEIDENNYYRREVHRGSFHRIISLPSAVNADGARADYEKGILKITLPKKDETKSKQIKISITKK